jgi:hypothetical protein
MKKKSIEDVIKGYLNKNGYDGLYNDKRKCWCGTNGIVFCKKNPLWCHPGYGDGEGFGWVVQGKKKLKIKPLSKKEQLKRWRFAIDRERDYIQRSIVSELERQNRKKFWKKWADKYNDLSGIKFVVTVKLQDLQREGIVLDFTDLQVKLRNEDIEIECKVSTFHVRPPAYILMVFFIKRGK